MRVFLVDAHPVFREGLKSIMKCADDIKVVGETDSCRNVLEKVGQQCDLLVLDGESDSLDLLQSLQRIRPKGRPPFTLVLTKRSEDQHAIQMLAAGANGCLDKSKSPQAILEAIRKVSRGGKSVSSEVEDKILLGRDRLNKPASLSPREYQVLTLLASGLTVTEIAGQLSLSVKTISTYRCRLLEKLNLKNNVELIRYALKEGLPP
jgi:two-component system invasion response regulator UvrY